MNPTLTPAVLEEAIDLDNSESGGRGLASATFGSQDLPVHWNEISGVDELPLHNRILGSGGVFHRKSGLTDIGEDIGRDVYWHFIHPHTLISQRIGC